MDIWTAHHSAIVKVEFSACGMFFVLLASDGRGSIWSLESIVDRSQENGPRSMSREPFRSWCPHILPITDGILIPSNTQSSLRVLTSGADSRLVLFDAFSNRMVSRLNLPVPATAICTNDTSDFVFAGCKDGCIRVIPMSSLGQSALTVQGVEQNAAQSSMHVLSLGNNSPVTAMVVTCVGSASGNSLICGTEDGTLYVWDVWRHTCIHSVRPLGERPITNLKVNGCD